ncbi:hypothetical protein MSG28_003421 [Choristoneura fumiferana]|uniref:Uncharacterized protein n=1 Tax=Choristoneura fumiferana TaxID=7141 RepID=A0ACC0KFG6_CHOFU|nr:hypothetical protein MSG28_003421 [Choristoneura fumiferana]
MRSSLKSPVSKENRNVDEVACNVRKFRVGSSNAVSKANGDGNDIDIAVASLGGNVREECRRAARRSLRAPVTQRRSSHHTTAADWEQWINKRETTMLLLKLAKPMWRLLYSPWPIQGQTRYKRCANSSICMLGLYALPAVSAESAPRATGAARDTIEHTEAGNWLVVSYLSEYERGGRGLPSPEPRICILHVCL